MIQHFMRVIGCDHDTFLRHRDAALKEWEARSKQKWRLSLGEYASLVKPRYKPGSEPMTLEMTPKVQPKKRGVKGI